MIWPVAQRNRVPLLLTGVIALAVAARCTDLGARLTMDDAYTWLTASSPNAHVFRPGWPPMRTRRR